jgi:nicotinate-nucleotide pyrophosphorylase (carboxylating)
MNDIELFLKEDLEDIGDITSDALFTSEIAVGEIIVNTSCIIAGLSEAKEIFEKTGATLKPVKKDGEVTDENQIIAEVSGPIKSILKAERLALNFLGRMSGIATITNQIVNECKKINSDIQIAATRKTTPGFRYYEKKAVKIGGGFPHRYGLFDEILIKDNHIKKIGGINKTIKLIQKNTRNKSIEIEVENEKDAIIAAENKIDIVMLDNFSAKKAKIITEKIKKIYPRIIVEISGRITPENITEYALFADRISLGYLTHSIKNIDYSLELK